MCERYKWVRTWRVLCPDGRIRTARQTGEPDTYFSVPARVSAFGKTVSGFVTTYSDVPTDDAGNLWDTAPRDVVTGEQTAYTFTPYGYRKNANTFVQRYR